MKTVKGRWKGQPVKYFFNYIKAKDWWCRLSNPASTPETNDWIHTPCYPPPLSIHPSVRSLLDPDPFVGRSNLRWSNSMSSSSFWVVRSRRRHWPDTHAGSFDWQVPIIKFMSPHPHRDCGRPFFFRFVRVPAMTSRNNNTLWRVVVIFLLWVVGGAEQSRADQSTSQILFGKHFMGAIQITFQ